MTPEIEKAYRNWQRSLAGNDATAASYLSKNVFDGTRPLTADHSARLRKTANGRGKHRRSPEAKEKMRQAALKRWAKKRAA